ncbi:unnamed protein product [Natator depressus]
MFTNWFQLCWVIKALHCIKELKQQCIPQERLLHFKKSPSPSKSPQTVCWEKSTRSPTKIFKGNNNNKKIWIIKLKTFFFFFWKTKRNKQQLSLGKKPLKP